MTEVPRSDLPSLAQQLADHDIRYLRVSEPRGEWLPMKPDELIATLSHHSEPRFREALIPLFIRHPEYARYVPGIVISLDTHAGDVLRFAYTAAVYLQRLWMGTLSLYLGDIQLLPDLFGQSIFGLPSPEVKFGEAGLRTLADVHKQQTGYEWLPVYISVMDLLLQQFRLDYDRKTG
jgi:hypothetical protein